jgi:uncharacterized protein (TIGR02246 family)
MRSTLSSILVAICVSLGGCGLVIGYALRESNRHSLEDSQVVASLARYRQLIIDVDAERLADMFVADGELSHDAEKPYLGQNQIRTFLRTFAGYKIQEYELRADSTAVEKETAKEHGTYAQVVIPPNGSPIKASGEFDATWQHQADGRWLLSRMHTTAQQN